MIDRPAALAALPESYGPLFDRAAAVFEADERVRAMWLHGALARGQADAASDMDILIAISDDTFEGFAASWRDWLAAITPTLTARPLSPGSFYALTQSCERFDVVAEAVGKLPATSHRRRLVVFDRDGLNDVIPPPADPPPDPAVITYLIEEALRQAANFPTVLVRDDWLMGVVAVQQVQMFLYQLFAESNKPAPATGPKQWSFKLTPAQRQVLSDLPTAAPSPDSVLAAREATFTVFFREAPPIALRNGVPWPSALEQAVRDYLREQGAPLPDRAD
ncbi:MAG: nucleotidyltransferase domain-containing protein [Candidatus Dormiibacterota bacterium]